MLMRRLLEFRFERKKYEGGKKWGETACSRLESEAMPFLGVTPLEREEFPYPRKKEGIKKICRSKPGVSSRVVGGKGPTHRVEVNLEGEKRKERKEKACRLMISLGGGKGALCPDLSDETFFPSQKWEKGSFKKGRQ